MTSTQMHPLFAAFAAAGGNAALGSSASTSSPTLSTNSLTISAASGNNHHSNSNSFVSPHHSPTGLGGLGLGALSSSGLSVTITPTSNSRPQSSSPIHSPNPNANHNASAVAALALAMSQQQGQKRSLSSPPESPPGSPDMSPPPSPSHDNDHDMKDFSEHPEFKDVKDIKPISSNSHSSFPQSMPMNLAHLSSGANKMALQVQQQQQLRTLASSLQSAILAAQQQAQQQQSNNVNLLGKLMELSGAGMDEGMGMSEITQRLVKMNQEIWQQGLASVAAAAGQQQQQQNNPPASPAPPQPSSHGPSASPSNGGGGGQGTSQSSHPPSSPPTPSPQPSNHGVGGNNANAALAAVAALSALTAGQQQHHVNEIKLAEKLVNELAVQIFMHKSAMQLQQQQQAAAQQAGGGHHLGPHGSLMRAGSSSGSESGAGISKPHQCQQCLKSFSSNHQLVQHIRVHTGEKPYKCSYCDRRFKQLSHVQQHTRLHTGERPYKCHIPECGRAFIQLSNLQQHLRNHDAQIERSKNRPFHCNICGKGFATESSLRTHTSKQHSALIGSSSALSCPVCHKLFLGGEALMEHMKYTHKDPNASGVATKRRTANHPCPICGKHYVNEGSLRKHLSCHPETAQLSSSLRMWPCSVCQAVFTHENGLLTHMDQMRMDPKHQFAAQYVLSRAAAERRERDNILAAAAISAMAQAGGHPFGGNPQGQGIQHGSLGPLLPMPPSPSGSESSGRLSSPLDTNSGMSHSGMPQHSRLSMSSPVGNNGPLELTRGHPNGNNNNSEMKKEYASSGLPGHNNSGGENSLSNRDEGHHHIPHQGHHPLGSGHHNILAGENGMIPPNSKQIQDAMKMAAMLGQGGHGNGQNDIRSLIHQQDMMTAESMRMQTESLLRSQAEALRLAVENHNSNNNNNSKGGSNGASPVGGQNGPSNGDGFGMLSQHQHGQGGHHHGMSNGHRGMMDHRMDTGQGNLSHSSHPHPHHPHASLNHHSHHQLNSLLSQQPDLAETLMRLDARTLGFPLPAHNS